MTTIAYRDGIMACDSCWTCGDGTVDTLCTKIVRLSSGALLGSAGGNDSRTIERLLDRVKTPAAVPSYEELAAIRQDFIGLLVLPKGQIYKIAATAAQPDKCDECDLGAWQIHGLFAAAGSGADLALGAMAAGKSAKEAVAIACRYDVNSRPPVHATALAGPRQIKKSK